MLSLFSNVFALMPDCTRIKITSYLRGCSSSDCGMGSKNSVFFPIPGRKQFCSIVVLTEKEVCSSEEYWPACSLSQS